ncbi:cytochrome o ubiquinol oxidase subunit IV [Pantoea sp. Aalb]|uniref:cytochrome o ubiquinol oxidase subunit IV n=1 Tax=Pantoea sp. Aalb TaxID=2576762 RepID=UPI001323AB8A|nr:cytochrome o ubiquinol oxidase subunit IV [Pantoea sp. Aalb]MXP67579.1 cytochrome o ubiquinol oxidase subunit IV [Pantoea sp. Aalb]
MIYFIKKKHLLDINVKSYIKGFIYSIILTIIPFWILINKVAPYITTMTVVLVCAIIQIQVHLKYFLHLDRKSEDGWNIISIIFAAIIILIIVIGSIWIMSHLNYNTMAYH